MLKSICVSALAFLVMQSCEVGTDPVSSGPTDTSVSNGNDRQPLEDPSKGSSTDSQASDNTSTDNSPNDLLPPATESRVVHFAPNDVTILFPAPASQADMGAMIKLSDFSDGRLLTASQFAQSMQVATGNSTLSTPRGTISVDAGQVSGTGHRISFNRDLRMSDWIISGIRIDPGAPGLSQNIFNVFGKSPQIRLVAQPFRQVGDDIIVEDISLHLVYAFHGPDNPAATCALHNVPDMTNFRRAVDDLKAIKDRFKRDHSVKTDNLPLDVHPAFATAGPEFKTALKNYLDTHLLTDRLFAVSIAGIPSQFEPWIFLAMQVTSSGAIEAVPSPATVQPGPLPQFSQMLSFIDDPQIVPAPATRNQRTTDCAINIPGTVTQQIPGAGTSTATIFDNDNRDIRTVVNIVANVSMSHFFNTDCVSCHTETRKEIDLAVSNAQTIGTQSGINPAIIPHGDWNVRVMGWAPTFKFNPNQAGAHATIARRTANETAEVIECFETEKWDSPSEACLP